MQKDRDEGAAGREVVVQDEARDGILEDILASTAAGAAALGLVVGRLCGWDDGGAPLVDFPGNPRRHPLPARSTVPLPGSADDREVALLFERNERRRPVIIGLIQAAGPAAEAEAVVDGRTVVLEGRERVELRCGRARIVLTADGKVLIRGADIASRAEGPIRLKGASVDIN